MLYQVRSGKFILSQVRLAYFTLRQVISDY